MQNTAADDSTSKQSSSSSSPQRRPPTVRDATDTIHSTQTTARGRGRGGPFDNARMIPGQVRGLTSGSSGGTGGDDGGGGGSSTAVAVAVAVGGSAGPTVAVEVAGGSVGKPILVGDGRIKRKRQPSIVKDPPPGTPSCPICHQEFKSWKAAFGHMRKHPRDYRGFYGPPAFSPPLSPTGHPQVLAQADAGEGGESTGEEGSSPTRGLAFDLNQPMEEVEEVSPAAAEDKNALSESDSEEKKTGFDLNEFPAPEDDGDKPSN